MARAKLQIHPLGVAIICFALVPWLIALGGVSGAALSCTRGANEALASAAAAAAPAPASPANDTDAATAPPPIAAAAVVEPPPSTVSSYAAYASCAQAYQWEWFSLWFSLTLIVAQLATAFVADSFRRGRAALLAFTTLCCFCLLLSAHNFITRVDISAQLDVRDLDQDSVNAAAAGFVLLALSMMALMLALGTNFTCTGCSSSSCSGGRGPLLNGGMMVGGGEFEGGGGGAGGTDYGAHVRYQASPPI